MALVYSLRICHSRNHCGVVDIGVFFGGVKVSLAFDKVILRNGLFLWFDTVRQRGELGRHCSSMAAVSS